MTSIFEGLTVSATGLSGDQPASPDMPPPVQPNQTIMPSGLRSLPPSQPHMQSQLSAVGSTGLMARVEPEEFLKIVTAAGTGVVLYTPQISPTPQRVAIDRYVASIAGIVFVTLAAKMMRFPSGIQVINASAVLCDSRPLSHQDTM